MDELIKLATPFVLAEVKKALPDADEKIIGEALVAMGGVLVAVGKGLAAQ